MSKRAATHIHMQIYSQTSNITGTKSKILNSFSSRLAVVIAQFNEAMCWAEDEDVVGAAPTGDAPSTSEWSTILLPTKVHYILEFYHSGRIWHYEDESNKMSFPI